MGTVNMAVDFGGVKMQNPINTAAGTFGYGWQFQNFFDVSQLGDQSRVATPSQAIERGASHIVVGRPITGADDPVAAFDAIVAELVENVA